ncbi:bifunctional 5,10-methylenetetrahydrofolate dehydrogenase/5,10-methenyltetrahydrofolate cyclohydrolase [Deinococcus radiophilus]|uniref:Bifunctional protein FolD n=1 Tax=Deinococcus radiophilus TaxID=32062 RepID=A0A431VVU6_9DEIO|nr:tetrahydrofolate dehydrogenase/cyclohydrolase catalytic domain-containing protein [Deinococcus radiophilus]RTR27290.1 bifunctional 5,10-methylene-tetrahydrofolate dehydrogenase/5,10-methylene-tetrahydrofolate cyclohydrolase [Deinococcus radiophilus]UFA50622.1 bifunctional 5,10-methylene-tetrahydrofolate dehydrogenase/5,10-methylene-tetrahydrofolate cyclohydrolase [Deinococcus radiophilus]
MTAANLAGKPVAEALLAEVAQRAQALPHPPRLALIRLGEDPASVSYVRSKDKKAGEVGIQSEVHALPEDTTQEELLSLIARLNAEGSVHGILVQLPLPAHIDEAPVLLAVDPAKDVDGFHPYNVAQMWAGHAQLNPCTPRGILEILDFYGVDVAGKRAVVVGRSEIVGRPMAAMLLGRDATVTIAHSRTADLGAVTREADILVVAVGRPQFITPEMVKPGATVIDVGINRIDVGGKGKIVGDVHPDVAEVAGGLTPVPGGVGLLTVAQLMANTVTAAELQAAER